MTLYDIDNEILSCIDDETGEIIDFEMFELLDLERNKKIENIILYLKNLIAEAEAIKAEIKNLTERKLKTENKIESLRRWIQKVLDGEKFKTSKVDVRYRKTSRVHIDDDFTEWAKKNRPGLLKFVEPQPDKTAIKNAINDGLDVEYASIETGVSMIIK